MAISGQFADIFKKYPKIEIKDEPVAEEQQQTITETQPAPAVTGTIFGKLNFTPVKVDGTKKPSPFGVMKSAQQPIVEQHPKIAAVITVDEDNNDDDPALEAVADKPYDKEAVVQSADNIPVKQAAVAQKEPDKVEQKEEPQQAPSKAEKATKKQGKAKPVVDTAVDEDEIADQYAIDNPAKYFTEKVAVFRGRFIQQEFQDYQNAIFARLNAIKIESSLNPGAIRVRLAEIDSLRGEIVKQSYEVQALLKASFAKEYGDVISTASMACNGSNDNERKKAYFALLKRYPITADEKVNMTFVCTVLDMYDRMFQTVLSELSVKQSMLVTFLGTLKMENNA